jgi:ribonuclease HII
MNKLYIIGVDEAGRGPWAGPVLAWGWMAESAVCQSLLDGFDWLGDSKMLPQHTREKIFAAIEASQYRDECQFAFAYREATDIDRVGIREANRQCMQDVLLSLIQFIDPSDFVEVYIDGCDNYIFDLGSDSVGYDSTRWSRKKEFQSGIHGTEHIKIYYRIWWDSTYKQVSAASIIAKVTRDRMMCDFHEDFPMYGFSSHKGYGTSIHRAALLNYGITPLHRKSYEPMKSLILQNTSV